MEHSNIEVVEADITTLAVAAIVNAANSSLLGGGGVDGAIHRAAGPELKKECAGLNGCNTGDARITGGYNLPAEYVIHTVGPVWRGGSENEAELLASCYASCLKIAAKNKIRSIAFPAISTGAYGFPPGQAARIAVAEIRRGLNNHPALEKIFVVCFDHATRALYEKALSDPKQDPSMKGCPCGSRKTYEQCCGPFLKGKDAAPTAEALMRSRYTAYAEKNEVYLLRTWHPATRPQPGKLGLDEPVSWTGLEIRATEAGEKEDGTGFVEFIAYYLNASGLTAIQEKSRFVRYEGKWVYVDGETTVRQPERPEKTGRNEPCFCGSGKKFKKCCLRKGETGASADLW